MALTRYRRRKGTVLPFFLRMKIHNQVLAIVDIDSVQPHPNNPKHGDVVVIAESIVHNGFYGAIIVQQSSGNILVGNHRWLAAKGTGAEKIPCIKIDVGDDDAKRIMLADNRTSELGGFDEAQLRSLIEEMSLGSQGLSGTGYRQEDLDALMKDIEQGPQDDSKPEGAVPLSAPEDRDKYQTLSVLRWGKFMIHLTDEEEAGLTRQYELYVERTGLEFGFVADLLEKATQLDDPAEES